MQQNKSNSQLPSLEWTLKEQRQALRELIVHEDNLSISRSQSLYTIQGFLFASLGLLAKGSQLPMWALKSFIGIVSFVGISAAITYFIELKNNDRAIQSIDFEWRQLSGSMPIPDSVRVMGYKNIENVVLNKPKDEPSFRLPRGSMPVVFIIAWVLMLILMFFIPLQ